MPLYAYRCLSCSATGTYVRKISEHHLSPPCEACGSDTRQRITPVRGFGDFGEYVSPVTGKLIRGRRQRQYDLESTGSRPYEGTEVELKEAARIRVDRQQKLDAQLDEAIERTITELDASNRLEQIGERNDPLPDFSSVRVYN